MNTYDVVPKELLLTSSDLRDWSPEVVAPEKIATAPEVTWATPAQIATFLTFEESARFNGYLSPDLLGGTTVVQDNWRRKALESQTNNGWHQAGFVAAMALWHVRDEPIDLIDNYAGYSSVTGGYWRDPQQTSLPFIAPDVAEKAAHFEKFLERDITNRQDAVCYLFEQAFPDFSEQLIHAVTEWVEDYPAYKDLTDEEKPAKVRYIIGFMGVKKALNTYTNIDVETFDAEKRLHLSFIDRLDSPTWI